MNIVRPVREEDLDAIFELSKQTKAGLTTLPKDKDFLKNRIKKSALYFAANVEKPGGEDYLFVMENTQTGEILGTSAIFSKVGGYEPFYTYEVKSHLNESQALKVSKEIQYLQLKMIHNGPTEIGSLFLSPDHRAGNNGRLLSLGRFMFIAQHRQCFEDEILAEMRGVIDEEGRTIFWEALGAHFFDVPFEKADLMAIKDKQFIADLMPQHPIYIPLLPKEAQMVIGEVHQQTRPARRLLEQEGLEFNNEVDIFEAGPVLSCKTENVRTIRESKIAKVSKVETNPISSRFYLVCNTKGIQEYKITASHLHIDSSGSVGLPEKVAHAIDVKQGDEIRYVPIRILEKR